MAKFQKGKSGNPAGKRPGTKSKNAEQIRGIVSEVLTNCLTSEAILKDISKLDPKDRLSVIDRLLKHVLPAPMDEVLRLSDADFDRLIRTLEERAKTF